jgi:hypothetical protein
MIRTRSTASFVEQRCEAKCHPRQWVDLFRSFLQMASRSNFNPTHGSGWILQIPIKDLNNPPTAVGGILKVGMC